jgi:hypothetical protein
MIDLPALTDPELASIDEHSPTLWMVRLDNSEYGPYFEDILKAYAHEHLDLFTDADVCELPAGEWQMYLQSKLKIHQSKVHAQLLSSEDLQTNQQYYFEQNNLKTGPVSFEKIKGMILAKELMPTDLVSSDECLTWSKVYHFEELMPLCVPSSGLPQAPLDSTLNRSADAALTALLSDESSIEDGLVSLAHYQQQKSGYNNLKLSEVEIKKPAESFQWPTVSMPMKKNRWAMPASVAAGCLTLIVSVWWMTAPKAEFENTSTVVESSPSQIEYTQPEQNLLNQRAPAPRLRVQGGRSPASLRNIPRIEARPFMDSRRDLVEYHTGGDYDQEVPEPRETMDAVDDPTGASTQYAQDQRDPNDGREPSAVPDDGYRLAPVGQDQQVIEESSDF